MSTISKDFIVKNGIVVGDNADVAGSVTAASFSGDGSALTGTASSFTASNVTTNANLTGDVTSTGNATKVAGQSGNTGKYLKTDGTSTSWASVSSTLASLTDVILDTPLVNQILGYNGATWTNINADQAAGAEEIALVQSIIFG